MLPEGRGIGAVQSHLGGVCVGAGGGASRCLEHGALGVSGSCSTRTTQPSRRWEHQCRHLL